jgi:hypothetical protein
MPEMSLVPRIFVGSITVACCFLGFAPSLTAQSWEEKQARLEIAPAGGYRFGGEFFELVSGQDVDLDGAPAVGLAASVPIWEDGLYLEGMYTHQRATFSTRPSPFNPPLNWNVTVDHFGVGGLREFRRGRVRPFLNSVFGMTRYAAEGDNEIRFTIGAGGGVKLFPSKTFGIRLDGRAFMTFVDAEGDFLACTPGICLLAFDVDVVWQTEFTAGLVIRFH